MSFALLGTKIGMTQVYDEENNLVPVTVVRAGPCRVAQIKTVEKDGYAAVQIGYNPRGKSPNKNTRPLLGHCGKSGIDPQAELAEFRLAEGDEGYEPGTELTVKNFEGVAKVDVVATTKGRGFQGVVKRWGFKGGPASHGSMTHRRGGAYGLCQWPGRVFKNKKMPGHMGDASRTTQNLEVVRIDDAKNLILLKGSVAGAKGSLLYLRPAKKTRTVA